MTNHYYQAIGFNPRIQILKIEVMSNNSSSSPGHSPAGKTVRLGSEYIMDPEIDRARESSWFRKQSSTSFLEPAIELARRLSVKINGPRGLGEENCGIIYIF